MSGTSDEGRGVVSAGGVPVRVHATAEELGDALASEIVAGVEAAREAGRAYLLGCPSGRSLESTYNALGRRAGESGADLSHVVIVMMDEYLTPTPGGFVLCPSDAHYSCRGFATRSIAGVVSAGLRPGRRIEEGQIWVADPSDPSALDRKVNERGGVDLFLLASGTSDGHVAFNPPGTPLGSETRIVALAESTRRDNMATFPGFASLDEVPTHGVSVGLATIARSRAVAMVLHGAHKTPAAARLLTCADFTPAWPASVVLRCRAPSIRLDAAAAGC